MKDISSDGIFIITSDYEGISNALLEAMNLLYGYEGYKKLIAEINLEQ